MAITHKELQSRSVPAIKLYYANGRDFARVYIPRPLVATFAALLSACVIQSKATRRLGNRTLISNCFSGMAGQIAMTLALRSFGLEAKMTIPSVGGDPGYDVSIGSEATIEVRTSSFADNRGVELMQHGDRFPLRNGTFAPRLYAWCVTQPNFFDEPSEMVYIDIVAVIPAGQVQPTTQRPVTAVPGMRLRNIDPKFSILWLLDVFGAVREKQSLLGQMPSFEKVDFGNILTLPFVVFDVIGSNANIAQNYDENTLAIARTNFTTLMRSIDSMPSSMLGN